MQNVYWWGCGSSHFPPIALYRWSSFSSFWLGLWPWLQCREMLRMKHLEIFSIEGILSMLAAFILAVPIDQYFISLPTNASVTGFAIISF